ncbi:MAG: hypothetical protein AB1324_03025 [Candidatus Micrarchaeota archaeon]
MPSDDFFSRVKAFFGIRPKETRYVRFRDGLGNFELFYPEGWKFDEDIAVMDGRYTISFQSGDGLSQFTVSVDVQLPAKFNFRKYAKDELESPESGIFTKVTRSKFHGMPSFVRDYGYSSGGREFFGGGVMFYSGSAVFSLSWSAPEKKKEAMGAAFAHMMKTLAVRKGFVIKKRSIPGVDASKLRTKNA